MLCSVEHEWCTAVAVTFQRETGIRVTIMQRSSAEGLAQLVAGKAHPAEQDLTEPYESKHLGELHAWARKQAETSGYRTVGLYNDVQMGNPNASGTAYLAIATLVQMMGEDAAFAYLKALHKNVSAYPKPARARSRRSRAGKPRSAWPSSTRARAKRSRAFP